MMGLTRHFKNSGVRGSSELRCCAALYERQRTRWCASLRKGSHRDCGIAVSRSLRWCTHPSARCLPADPAGRLLDSATRLERLQKGLALPCLRPSSHGREQPSGTWFCSIVPTLSVNSDALIRGFEYPVRCQIPSRHQRHFPLRTDGRRPTVPRNPRGPEVRQDHLA